MISKEELKEKGRKLYRQFLKEDLESMKNLIEGMRYVGSDEVLLQEYKWLANDCLMWKRLIKLNK